MKSVVCKLWVASLMIGALGCGGGSGGGAISIDGSSTVAPISEAVAEEYRAKAPNVRVTVGTSGTGGGMKKLIEGAIVIADASREMKDSEAEQLKEKGIETIELEIAYDGLAVVAHPDSKIECITVAQLKKIWEPGSKIKKWNEVDPSWPDSEIALYGPGADSGTFDYFTEVICGESKASRADYTASEDDGILVTGVSKDPNSLGYFGLAYYEENKEKLKLLGVDGGGGCVSPTPETVADNSYAPLSRPLFIYVRKDALTRPEVVDFLNFYLDNASALATEVGYVALTDEAIQAAKDKLKAAVDAAK